MNSAAPTFAWQPGFAALGPAFATPQDAQPVPSPHWIATNDTLAAQIGLPAGWANDAALAAFAGNARLPGSTPQACVYSGHQFGVWAGQLGDGRALLLGETASGWELQLKGSGRTPYSRMGDGRAVLRSSIREYLASEAMAGLGVPTTRALCLVGSPLPVAREEMETAAVLARAAASFVRFGHFEHFAARGQTHELRQLADYAIARYDPACADAPNPYAALLTAVSERTADLLAHWQAIGFCHGVMNTDNMSILGLTLDYGPFQFLDAFDPHHICNHSDRQGRYAFGRQPAVAHWNLRCLAQALLPLIREVEDAQQALDGYAPRFEQQYLALMHAKLGLQRATPPGDALVAQLLAVLAAERVDYPLFWRRLSEAVAGDGFDGVRALCGNHQALDAWLLTYQELLAQEGQASAADLMLKTNPRYVLRNHVAELAIRAAKLQDTSSIHTLQTLLAAPCSDHPGHAAWAEPPPDWAASLHLSCSS